MATVDEGPHPADYGIARQSAQGPEPHCEAAGDEFWQTTVSL
jgi:hypothetical protein